MRAKLSLKKRMKIHTNTIAVQQLSIPRLSNLAQTLRYLAGLSKSCDFPQNKTEQNKNMTMTIITLKQSR